MRKGVMFSFIMIFVTLSILTLIFINNSLISHRREEIFIEMRINNLNNMYEGLIKDLDKSLQIISRRAISVAYSNVSVPLGDEPPQPLDNADIRLAELIENGTLKGSSEPLMENATFTEWINKIKELSVLKGFESDIEIISLEVKPYDYIHLLVKTELNVSIIDKQGVAELNRSATVNSIVSLEGLEDPLYPLYTSGFGSNLIRKSPYLGDYTQLLLTGNGGNSYVYGESTHDTGDFDDKILITSDLTGLSGLNNAKGVIFEQGGTNSSPINVPYLINSNATTLIPNSPNLLLDGGEGKVWYIDNLIEDTENSYYHPSENGPSYLDRLEGKFVSQSKYKDQTDKTIGLESFVNKLDVYFTGGNVTVHQEKTNIDYIYFSTNSPTSKKVKGLDLLVPDPYFRIDDDDDHEESYNVTELVY